MSKKIEPIKFYCKNRISIMDEMGIVSSYFDINTTPPNTPTPTPTPPVENSDYYYYTDTLLSGIQKYWRHRNIEKMCWCIQEMINGNKSTVLCQRLESMLEEELSFIDIHTYLRAHEDIRDFQEHSDPVPLFLLAKRVCKARLSHLPNDIYTYFHDYRHDKNIFKTQSDSDTPASADTSFYMFKRMMASKNTECFYWLFQFLHTYEHKERNDMFWNYLETEMESMSMPPEIKHSFTYRRKRFEFEHDAHEERARATINAVLTLFYCEEVTEYVKDNELPMILIPDSPPNGIITLDDHSNTDTHYIENEDKTFYMEHWRRVYCKRKGETFTPEKAIMKTKSKSKPKPKPKTNVITYVYTPPRTRNGCKKTPGAPVKHTIRKSRSRRVKRRKSSLFKDQE